jgi:catechol 2,3-dioxygenase-like lactoylglutathione lyase family enzyme
MPAPFNIVGIDHIVLRAVDPAALERFYLNVLGLSLQLLPHPVRQDGRVEAPPLPPMELYTLEG